MIIEPLGDIIQLELEEAHAGVLDTSSRTSAVEYATVSAVADNITRVKVGDKVFVKSWGIDIVTHEEKRYYFVNVNTNAILAVVR